MKTASPLLLQRSPWRVLLALVLAFPIVVITYVIVAFLLDVTEIPPANGILAFPLLIALIREFIAASVAAAFPVYLMRRFLHTSDFELSFYIFVIVLCGAPIGALVLGSTFLSLKEKPILSYILDLSEIVAFMVGAWLTRRLGAEDLNSPFSRQIL